MLEEHSISAPSDQAGCGMCFIGYGIDSSDSVNLYLGIVLCTVVFITSTFSYLQERKSAKIMEGFKSLIPKKCNVIRDGGIVKIDALELVPGDVVEFTDGDQVPADIRVVKCNDLKVDNSSLTGESEPQERVTGLAKDSDGNEITTVLEATNLLFYTTIRCVRALSASTRVDGSRRTPTGEEKKQRDRELQHPQPQIE